MGFELVLAPHFTKLRGLQPNKPALPSQTLLEHLDSENASGQFLSLRVFLKASSLEKCIGFPANPN